MDNKNNHSDIHSDFDPNFQGNRVQPSNQTTENSADLNQFNSPQNIQDFQSPQAMNFQEGMNFTSDNPNFGTYNANYDDLNSLEDTTAFVPGAYFDPYLDQTNLQSPQINTSVPQNQYHYPQGNPQGNPSPYQYQNMNQSGDFNQNNGFYLNSNDAYGYQQGSQNLYEQSYQDTGIYNATMTDLGSTDQMPDENLFVERNSVENPYAYGVENADAFYEEDDKSEKYRGIIFILLAVLIVLIVFTSIFFLVRGSGRDDNRDTKPTLSDNLVNESLIASIEASVSESKRESESIKASLNQASSKAKERADKRREAQKRAQREAVQASRSRESQQLQTTTTTTKANTPKPTATNTPKPTVINAPKPTATNTPKPTATNTPKPTATNTPKSTATNTPKPTATNTPEPTATNTPEPTATNTPEPTATNTPEPTATNTPEPTATNTPEPTATNTPEPTATDTPEPTATDTPEPTATDTPEPTATNTPEPTEAPTPTEKPSPISDSDMEKYFQYVEAANLEEIKKLPTPEGKKIVTLKDTGEEDKEGNYIGLLKDDLPSGKGIFISKNSDGKKTWFVATWKSGSSQTGILYVEGETTSKKVTLTFKFD